MPIFALRNITGLSKEAQEKFKQLEIKESVDKDGTGQLDEFEKKLEGTTFKSEFRTFLSYLDHWAQNINQKPPKKFNNLSTKKSKESEFEYKSDNLRIYITFISRVGIVVYADFKKPSKQDNHIEHFRNLKASYLKQLS